MDTSSLADYSFILLEVATTNMGFTFYVVSSLILLVLVILSALVSGSEVGLFSLSPIELNQCKESENKKERLIYKLLQKPQQLLATILIFNNLINVSIVTISTFVTWEILGTKEMGFVAFFIQTFLITAVLLIFGELLPKVYANQKNISFVKITIRMIAFTVRIFHPFSFLLMSMGNLIERRIEKKGYTVSSDQLKGALEVTSDTSDKEKEILKGIINFHNITVKQIMTSRLDIKAFDKSMNFKELVAEIKQNNHSRIPIYKDTIDHIDGFLYIKDLLPFLEEQESFEWQRLIRQSYFVPQNKKIDKLLKDFQEKHIHISIVVDEYGGTAGLVTLEDILEEIVGEINDEQDEMHDKLHMKLDENNYLFESKILLQDFTKIMNLDSDFFGDVKGESESLGGLMLELFTRLPNIGEYIEYEHFLFTIAAVGKRKIKVVKVTILEVLPKEDE